MLQAAFRKTYRPQGPSAVTGDSGSILILHWSLQIAAGSRVAVCILALITCALSADAADWPTFGGDQTRNSVSREQNPPTQWDIKTGQNIRWTARLGSMTHGTPVVANGQVYIGTNNGAGYLERYPSKTDLGCLLCFRESDGEFLWQYSAEKHPRGRVHDWPLQGLGGTPLVEGDRLWVVSNRWEVLCLDTCGFLDGENDGPVLDEAVQESREADIVWRFDLIGDLGVFPHCAGMGPDRRCCPAVYQNRLYVITGKGVDEGHLHLPTPHAPSLVCLDKHTGKVLWTNDSPGANVLHTQVASTLVAEIAGKPQVIVPQGDGWVRSFDAINGELIWEFDINRKKSKWTLGGLGDRNNLLASPVLYGNRIYIAGGQEAEHGEGLGRLVCIDPTKTGDISSELAVDEDGQVIPHRRLQAVDPAKGERAVANPNSGLVWEFTRIGDRFEDEMHRTVSSVAISDGLLVAVDTSGLVHCLDADTGNRHWSYDPFAAGWAGPLIVGGFVYTADEDGDVAVFRLSADPDVAMRKSQSGHEPLTEINMGNSVYVSPIYANGTLYVAAKSMLYAITADQEQDAEPEQKNSGPAETGEAANRRRPRAGKNRAPDAIFVPTPHDVVERMLQLAEVEKSDVVYDLGSGDGRVVIAAAMRHGTKALGIEIDPELVALSQKRVQEQKLEKLVRIEHEDMFLVDLSVATVVTTYLYPRLMERLIPQLNQMQPGSRIVSHHFMMPDIAPERVIRVRSAESQEEHTLYLWTTPLELPDSAESPDASASRTTTIGENRREPKE